MCYKDYNCKFKKREHTNPNPTTNKFKKKEGKETEKKRNSRVGVKKESMHILTACQLNDLELTTAFLCWRLQLRFDTHVRKQAGLSHRFWFHNGQKKELGKIMFILGVNKLSTVPCVN